MANFEIHTLQLGEIDLPLPHGAGILNDPVHAWLVIGGDARILVDSGMPEAELMQKRLNVASRGGGHETLRRELARVGVSPDDITHVVLTHLHFDHAWNLDLFPNACVVVQRDEIFHAIDPAPTQRIYYFRETLIDLLKRKRPKELRFVNGDECLLEGFQLIKTPGHTPGMQVAVVATERGQVGLVSDLGDHYRYWYPADPIANSTPLRFLADSFLPGPIRTESEAAYVGSMRRVFELADIVVPAHDARIPRHIPKDWFAIPPITDEH